MEIRTTDRDTDHLRELLVEGKSISRLVVVDCQMRIGSAIVQMAGIGDVHTEWSHRKQGHMRRLMEDSLTYMRDQGYDVSMLFGIRNFYNKFGYAVCLPSHKFEVKTRDAEQAQADPDVRMVRPIASQQMEAVLALYNQNNATRTCSIVRSPERFSEFNRWGAPVDHLWIEGDRGRLLAYAVCDRSDEAVSVIELESVDDHLYSTLLHEFAETAIERRCGEIVFHMAPDHPFVEYVQRFGCERSTERPKAGGGMMRIINQDALFAKIQPELERRLAACVRQFDVTLALRTNIGTTTLIVDGASVSTGARSGTDLWVELSQDRLMQLVAGHRSARDILNDPDVASSDGVMPLLDILFPRRPPYTWWADRF